MKEDFETVELKTLSVRLSPKSHARIKIMARKNGLTMSKMAIKIMNETIRIHNDAGTPLPEWMR